MESTTDTGSIGVIDEDRNDPPTSSSGAETSSDVRQRLHVVMPLRWLVIGLLVIALAGVAGCLGIQQFQQHQKRAAAEQAVDAAKKYALALCNIDAGTVDKTFTDLAHNSTDDLNSAHVSSAAKLRQIIVDKKVTAHGNITDAAVESVSTDKVSVLLLVDQSVSNLDTPQPQVDRTHIKITMERVDDRWLASDVELR